MNITKRLLTQLQSIIKKYKFKLKVTKNLHHFNQETQIGKICGDDYLLTASCHQEIIDFCLTQLNWDVKNDSLTESRIEHAQYRWSEKLAGNAFINRVLVNQQRGNIQLTQGVMTLVPGCCLQITIDDLLVDVLQQVIIVENGEPITTWDQVNLPDELTSVPAIYRGHGQDSKAIHRWLKMNHQYFKLIASVDLDPSGLVIANTLQANAILIPKNISCLKQLSNTNKFEQQIQRYNQYLTKLPYRLQTLWQLIVQHRLAITQETMINNKIPLQLFPIT